MNFTSVDEAQALLGRDLTGAETLWFNLTNGVPDYQLYSLTAILLMLMYPVACLPYFILDYLKLPFFEQYRLQPTVPHTPAATWQAMRSVMITFTTVVVPLQVTSYPFFKVRDFPVHRLSYPMFASVCIRPSSAMACDNLYLVPRIIRPRTVLTFCLCPLQFAGVNSDLPLPTLTTVALQLVVFFLIEDYGNYWIHRMFHWSFLYEKFHYLHHEYTSPLAASATYAHWVEVLVLGVPTLIGPTMVKCHVVTLWLWILIRQMEAIETHSG